MNILEQTVRFIEKNPQSGEALTLYALVSTLEYSGAGCLFKLDKLRLLNAEQRQLAYGLMELMALGATGKEDWKEAKCRMDGAIRDG